MTAYYIEKDNKIIIVESDKNIILNRLKHQPQYQNLEIKETKRPLALSDDGTYYIFADTPEYNAEQLQKAKETKIQEATDKAYSFEEKDALVTVNATNLKTRASAIYHIEGNLTNNIKMSAYASTLDDTTVVPWNTKENVNILLNKTACQTLTSLMSQMNAKLWTVDFPTYLAQIDTCETADEVNAINIEYQSPSDVVDITMAPAGGQEEHEEEPSGVTPPQDDEETTSDSHSEALAEESIEENNEVTDEDTTNNDVPDEVQEKPAADIVQSKSTKK